MSNEMNIRQGSSQDGKHSCDAHDDLELAEEQLEASLEHLDEDEAWFLKEDTFAEEAEPWWEPVFDSNRLNSSRVYEWSTPGLCLKEDRRVRVDGNMSPRKDTVEGGNEIKRRRSFSMWQNMSSIILKLERIMVKVVASGAREGTGASNGNTLQTPTRFMTLSR